MIYIDSDNSPIDVVDLARIEAKMGRPFPEPYRAFLLAHNGGRPNPDVIDVPDAPFMSTDVQVLHGIHTVIKTSDLAWNLDVLEGCVENHLLPIACDSLGNIYMLVLNEEDYGQVYYFDSAETPPKPYFLANDFDEFLSKIREPTPWELGEDESSLAESETVEPVDISFQFTGSRPADAALGNAAAGYETTPRGYVWHRHQDGQTLQLVPKDVHKQTGDPAGYALRWRRA